MKDARLTTGHAKLFGALKMRSQKRGSWIPGKLTHPGPRRRRITRGEMKTEHMQLEAIQLPQRLQSKLFLVSFASRRIRAATSATASTTGTASTATSTTTNPLEWARNRSQTGVQSIALRSRAPPLNRHHIG